MGRAKKRKQQRRAGQSKPALVTSGDHLGPTCYVCNKFFTDGVKFRQLVMQGPVNRRINLCFDCAAEFEPKAIDLGDQGTAHF